MNFKEFFESFKIDMSEWDEYDIEDYGNSLMSALPRGSFHDFEHNDKKVLGDFLKQFTKVHQEYDGDNYTPTIRFIFKHEPSSRFFAVEGQSDSWFDDENLGEGSKMYEVKSKQVTVTKYVRLDEVDNDEDYQSWQ